MTDKKSIVDTDVEKFFESYRHCCDEELEQGCEVTQTAQLVERVRGESIIRQTHALEAIAEALEILVNRGAGR